MQALVIRQGDIIDEVKILNNSVEDGEKNFVLLIYV